MTSIFSHKFWRIFVLIAFAFQTLTSDAFLTSVSQNPISIKPFTWAAHLGTIVEQSQGSRGPFILHIQEAHSVPQAQKKIAEIIQWFQNQGLSKESLSIAVEGAVGPIPTSFLGNFPYAKGREEITQTLIDEGWLTGAEALAISHPEYRLRIFGIEESQAYLKNFWSFRKAQAAWHQKESQWNELTQMLDQTRENVDSPTLLRWSTQFFHFKDGNLSFKDWISFLNQEKFHPQNEQARTLLQTLQQISGMDESAIKKEFMELSEKISKKSSKEDLKKFIELQLRFRLGKIDSTSYYEELANALDKNELSLKDFPHLQKTIQLQQKLSEIEWDKALETLLNDVESHIQNHLIKTEEERSLWDFEKSLRLAQHVFQLKASRKEWEEFKRPGSISTSFRPRIQTLRDDRTSRLSFPKVSIGNPFFLTKEISQLSWFEKSNLSSTEKENFLKNHYLLLTLSKQAQEFYYHAEERDEILFKNIESLIKKEKPKALIVITGGFHTSPLLQKLKEKHFSFCSVTPQMSGTISDELYLKRMMDQTLESNNFHTIPLASILNPLFDLLNHEAAEKLRKNIMGHFVAWARRNNIAREAIIARWPKPNIPSAPDQALITALSQVWDAPITELPTQGITEEQTRELVKLGEPISSLLEQYLTQIHDNNLLEIVKAEKDDIDDEMRLESEPNLLVLINNPFIQHILKRRKNLTRAIKDARIVKKFLVFNRSTVKRIFDRINAMPDERILEKINKFLASNLINNITGPIEEFLRRETVADNDFHQVFMNCVHHLMTPDLLDQPREIGKRYLAYVEYGYLLLKAVEILSRTKPYLLKVTPATVQVSASPTNIRDKDEAICEALTERIFQETNLGRTIYPKIDCEKVTYKPVGGGHFTLEDDDITGLIKFIRIGPLFFIEEDIYQGLSSDLRKDLGDNVIRLTSVKGDIAPLMYGNYTRAVITMMLNNDFSGKRVVDAGAGNGILSLVALKLGATFVDLIDHSIEELERAKALLELNGFVPEKHFLLHMHDLKNPDAILKVLSSHDGETAVISNIGTHPYNYTVTNADSIRLASKIPRVTLFIGGGDEDTDDFSQARSIDQELIGQEGFVVHPVISRIHDYETIITAWAATKKVEERITPNEPEADIEEKVQKAREKNKSEEWVGRKNDHVLTTLKKPFERRHVAIGDVHGEQFAVQQNLRDAGLVDENDDWIGGNAIVVQLGDIIDRGPHSYEVDVYLRKLQQQARKAGGNVIRLLGNHEDMFLRGMLGDKKQYNDWWLAWTTSMAYLYNPAFNTAFQKVGYNNFPDLIKSDTPPEDPELLKWWHLYRNLLTDIENGNIQAAYEHNNVLFTHAGLKGKTGILPASDGKTAAAYNAERLNEILIDEYFRIKNPPPGEEQIPRSPFLLSALWNRALDSSPAFDLQVVAHVPNQNNRNIRIGEIKVIRTDIGQSAAMYQDKGRRGYVDIEGNEVRGIDLAKTSDPVLPEGVRGYKGIPNAIQNIGNAVDKKVDEVLSKAIEVGPTKIVGLTFDGSIVTQKAFPKMGSGHGISSESLPSLAANEGVSFTETEMDNLKKVWSKVIDRNFQLGILRDENVIYHAQGSEEIAYTHAGITKAGGIFRDAQRRIWLTENFLKWLLNNDTALLERIIEHDLKHLNDPDYRHDNDLAYYNPSTKKGLLTDVKLAVLQMILERTDNGRAVLIEDTSVEPSDDSLVMQEMPIGISRTLTLLDELIQELTPKKDPLLTYLRKMRESINVFDESPYGSLNVASGLLAISYIQDKISFLINKEKWPLCSMDLKDLNHLDKLFLKAALYKEARTWQFMEDEIPLQLPIRERIHTEYERLRQALEDGEKISSLTPELLEMSRTLLAMQIHAEYVGYEAQRAFVAQHLPQGASSDSLAAHARNRSQTRGKESLGNLISSFLDMVLISGLYGMGADDTDRGWERGVKIYCAAHYLQNRHLWKDLLGISLEVIERDENQSGRAILDPEQGFTPNGPESLPFLRNPAYFDPRQIPDLSPLDISAITANNIANAINKFASRKFSPHLQQLLEHLVDLDVPIEFLMMVLDHLSSGDSKLANELITKISKTKPEVIHALIHFPAEQAAEELIITQDSWRKLQEAA